MVAGVLSTGRFSRVTSAFSHGDDPWQGENVTVDPLNVFLHARRFRLMDEGLRRGASPEVMVSYGPGVFVLSAFSLELYFKTLICVEDGALVRGHNLKNLFQRVSRKTQRRIEEEWDEQRAKKDAMFEFISRTQGLPPPPRDWATALEAGARAFEQFRYVFEGELPDYLLGDMPAGLDRIVIELKPEWTLLRPRPPVLLGRVDNAKT